MAQINPILPNGLGSPFNIHTAYVDGDRPHKVGTRGWLPDGRVFYWARNGTTAALTRALVIAQAAVTANHLDQTVNAAANFVAGSLDATLTVGATDILLREYEEGLVSITDGTGEGFHYQIRRHGGRVGAGTVAAKLYSPIVTGTAAASTISLLRNPYMNPRISPAASATAVVPVGVPNITLAAATSAATATAEAVGATWGWLQTWGPCPVLAGETEATVGQAFTMSGAVDGAVIEDATATTVSQQYIVGYNMLPLTDTEFATLDLCIRP